jgi:hypothetical protein
VEEKDEQDTAWCQRIREGLQKFESNDIRGKLEVWAGKNFRWFVSFEELLDKIRPKEAQAIWRNNFLWDMESDEEGYVF